VIYIITIITTLIIHYKSNHLHVPNGVLILFFIIITRERQRWLIDVTQRIMLRARSYLFWILEWPFGVFANKFFRGRSTARVMIDGVSQDDEHNLLTNWFVILLRRIRYNIQSNNRFLIVRFIFFLLSVLVVMSCNIVLTDIILSWSLKSNRLRLLFYFSAYTPIGYYRR